MKTVAKVLAVLLGILMIGAGVTCLFQPAYTSLILGYALGLAMIFDAVGGFISWHREKQAGQPAAFILVSAILSAVFGFFVLNNVILQGLVDIFIVYYFAVWLLIHGILDIFQIRRLQKAGGERLGLHWGIQLVLGILVSVFGVICLIEPIIAASLIGIFIGLGIITAGASLITLATLPEN